MLITSQFVVVNIPKSGSSFVRSAIKAIYDRRRRRHRFGHRFARHARWLSAAWFMPARTAAPDCFLKDLMLPNIRLPNIRQTGWPKDQHGVVAQIPPRYRDRTIMSVIRNPYEKIVSEYRFRWWATHPPIAEDRLKILFPAFPDISFDDFLTLSDAIAATKQTAMTRDGAVAGIGNMTVEFVQFFFRDPPRALRSLSDDYIGSGAFRADMVEVVYLRQESLNEELATFLENHGFDACETALCRDHARVNVTGTATGTRSAVRWTASGLAHFERRERHLFGMLAAQGFAYVAPTTIGDAG